jgi:iron complex transport system permease protein
VTRGLNVGRAKALLFITTSLVVGQIVSIAGPVGFVGMMVPHICRRVFGPGHRLLLPFSFFMGGAFLVLSDTLAKSLIAPAEIPVGVITALMGGPFFLVILLRPRGFDL